MMRQIWHVFLHFWRPLWIMQVHMGEETNSYKVRRATVREVWDFTREERIPNT